MNEFLIELQAKLSEEGSKGNINGDIEKIQKDLNHLKLKAELDSDTISKLTKEIEKVITKKITISNIEINPASVTKSAQQTGEQIGNIVSKSANKAISRTSSKSIGKYFKIDPSTSDKLNSEMEKLVNKWTKSKGKLTDIKINTKTSFDEESGENITRLHQALVTYKNELDEVIQKTIAWRQIGVRTNENGEEEALRGFVEVAGQYSKSIDTVSAKTDNFAKKQKETVANMQNTINQITSRAFDSNSSRPITSDSSLEKLNTQVAYVENAMYDLRNATSTTFDDAKIKVQEEISQLKILEKELRNADAALSKQKDFSATKIEESNNLDTFVQKMEQSGHYTDELKNKVSMLRADLSNVFDENSLTNYLNGLSNLKNEFQKVDTTAKTSEKESNQLIKKLEKSYQTIKNLEIKKDALDVSKDINQIAELDEQLKTAKRNFDSLFTQTNVNSNFAVSKWDETKTAIDAATQSQIEYNNAKRQDILDSSINETSENLNKLKSVWEEQKILVGEFKAKVEELEIEFSSIGNQNELDGLKTKIEILKTEASYITEINDIKSLSNGGIKNDYSTQLAKLEGQFRSLGLTEDEVKTKTSNVSKTLDALKVKVNQPFDKSDYQEIISLNDKLQKELAESNNEYTKLQSSAKGYVSVHQRLIKANTIEAWNQKNSNATKDAIANNKSYIASLRNLNSQMTKMEFEQISRGFKETENSMRGINRLGASLKNQFTQAAQGFTQWLSVSSGVMLVASQIKNSILEIKELNNILTEVSKTSDLTAKELKQLGEESYSAASKYGRTASDYLSGVQSMSQSGFYGEKGKAMAEQSLLAQSAGDMAQDIADSYVIATNAAYKFNGEASKINDVLDGQNSISNRNSVALEDMATAMSEAGTVASSYNVAIEDLSAMIGTMEAVTKSGGSEVGNSIKSILINLQNITSDKITKTLNKANASMTEMVNGAEKLRNPISIIRDLAKTFNQLDDDDPLRAEILTNVAGKYQSAKLAALLQNMEMFDKMLVDYSNGSGSALEEANKSANNLTGSLNKLSNSWTELINSMIKSDDLKAGVNLLNSIVQGATKLVSILTPLGTIGAGAGLFAGFKNIGKCRISVRIS